MAENWTKELPNGWRGGEAVTKWWRGSMLHLYRLRKPCAQCSNEMVIDVTAAALSGDAKNAGLLLQRCQNCRAASKGGTSRPRTDKLAVVTPQATVQGIDVAEHAQVKAERDEYAEGIAEQMTRCGVLQRKHDALFAELQIVKAENATLRNKFALYELQPAMERQAKIPADVEGQKLLKKFLEKMPWDA
jgi:hypothetical protein